MWPFKKEVLPEIVDNNKVGYFYDINLEDDYVDTQRLKLLNNIKNIKAVISSLQKQNGILTFSSKFTQNPFWGDEDFEKALEKNLTQKEFNILVCEYYIEPQILIENKIFDRQVLVTINSDITKEHGIVLIEPIRKLLQEAIDYISK